MFCLTASKQHEGKTLENEVVKTEGRVTFNDGPLATTVRSA